MPNIEDIFCQLNSAKYFSTLNLRVGYHHIPLDEVSIFKTTFTSQFEKYEYIKVPFGLAQAPAYFQQLMTGILKDFNFTIAYLDDIIIFSKIAEEHVDHISQYINDSMSVFSMNRINFYFNTSFCQVTYSGFLRCEGKCSPYQQVGMCWKILFLINLFLYYLIYFN